VISILLVKRCLELQVFSILQFGEASRRELATTEFLTTATIAITVLSDHGSGGWRKATQTARSWRIRSERSAGKGHHRRRGVSDARQRSGGVEKYSSIASRQAPEHGSTASSWGPDWRISAAIFSAQLMQTPARSIPQPVQLQLDL
jgi:uncharacterized protein YfiM (DUF2279 family)